jgi:hypothetical protein
MKIINFESSRATWLFPLEEFTPVGGSDAKKVLGRIAAKYGFSHTPTITTREDMTKAGLHFGVGQFEIEGRSVNISDFFIYEDGLAAVSHRTEWAESFLVDIVKWTQAEFGFRETSIKSIYSSGVVVEFETPLAGLFFGYEKISELITGRTKTIMPMVKPMQFSRFDFEIDKLTLEGQTVTPKFIIERRAGTGFERERYYSAAPMSTTDHLEVLGEIEKLAIGLLS